MCVYASRLQGNMSQPKRLGALNKFKGGERPILVATDVASRGLDIPAVDLVLNYDVPANRRAPPALGLRISLILQTLKPKPQPLNHEP